MLFGWWGSDDETVGIGCEDDTKNKIQFCAVRKWLWNKFAGIFLNETLQNTIIKD